MPRKFNPEPRVKTIHRTRPNGDIYVIERTVIHDREKGYDKVLGEKLIGKIPNGSGQMVPTRPRRASRGRGVVPRAVAVRTGVGLADILDFVGKESGVDDDLLKAVGAGERVLQQKVLSVARYWVATAGKSLAHVESWQDFHPLPWPDMSEDVCHDLFRELGERAEIRQDYFSARALRMSDKGCIALDSTAVDGACSGKAFSNDKSGTVRMRNGKQPSLSVDGEQFCQTIANDYLEYLNVKIADMQMKLNESIKENNLDVSALSLRKNLLSWLTSRTPAEMLEWFGCMEQIEQFKEGTYPYKKLMDKITAESTARDELFLDLLGMSGHRTGTGG